jgi:glycosyltransferase involved in cell wall biosynthesis
MKNKARIFVDMHLFDGPMQGSRTYLGGLYNAMIRNNSSADYYFGASDIKNLIKVFSIHPNVRFIKYFTRNKFIRLAFNIPYIILKYKIDIAHFQYILPVFKFSKEVITIHDVLFLDFPELFSPGYRLKNNFLFRRSAHRADFILTVSEYARNGISQHFNIAKELIHVVPNGVSNDYFDYSDGNGLPDIKGKYNLDKYILYVSRIEPRKNHIGLVKAFMDLRLWEEDYSLVFNGNLSIKTPDLTNYINDLPQDLRKYIVHIKSSHGSELMSFYRNCRLFVYPSLAEGFGIPPLEAAALEVPVLCSNATALGEFTFFRERLFNPSSHEEFKAKIHFALTRNDPDLPLIRDFVRVNYGWNKPAEILTEIIFGNAE